MSETASILVVDDESSIRFFLSEALERDGYQVTTAQDGYEALERLELELGMTAKHGCIMSPVARPCNPPRPG